MTSKLAAWTTDEAASYFRELCPGLHVGDQGAASREASKFDGAEVRARIQAEGFVWVSQVVEDDAVIGRLARAATELEAGGWPASFLLLFDEAWAVIETVRPLLEAAGGKENRCNGDILACRIDPSRGQAGFTPHRDRQPEDTAASFRDNGDPKYITCWLALSDATPDNSCLYVIPRHADPGYASGDREAVDPLWRALPTKQAYQHIRALPLKAGGAAVFTHRIIHWGSQVRAGDDVAPRISLSFASSSDDFEPSYLADPTELPVPGFELRLALACAQMISYHERFEPPPPLLLACFRTMRRLSSKLADSYRKKVLSEFVAAVKELGKLQSEGPSDQFSAEAKAAVEELSEEMMEALLEIDDAEDDFDEMADDLGVNVDDVGGDEDVGDDDDEEDDEDEDGGEDQDIIALAKRRKVA